MGLPEKYDAIVVGAGQAGGPIATALGRTGRKTAIIEAAEVGGSCINYGCTPTKTMVASARAAHMARRGPDYGVVTGRVRVNMEKVRQRKRDMVELFHSGSEHRIIESENVTLIYGEARFISRYTLEVHLRGKDERITVTAPLIIINTGARPVKPDIEGLDRVTTYTSTTIQELAEVPEHLLVLGGGYIGLEFGQMFRRFGSRVTVVQRGPRLLSKEDPDVAEEVAAILRDEGIDILLEAQAVHVAEVRGKIVLTIQEKEKRKWKLRGTHLLLAAGRKPDTERLNPQASGIKVDERGAIPVNERLETNVPGIYAVGDVNGGPAFTHISYDDFRILRTNLVEGGNTSTTGRLVPYTVFTDPQLGRIGLSEEEARKSGRRIGVAKMPADYIARALEIDETRGFIKAIVDMQTKQIIGAAALTVEGGEVMAMLQIAMLGKVPYPLLENGIFAHPTLAEAMNNLFAVWLKP